MKINPLRLSESLIKQYDLMDENSYRIISNDEKLNNAKRLVLFIDSIVARLLSYVLLYSRNLYLRTRRNNGEIG